MKTVASILFFLAIATIVKADVSTTIYTVTTTIPYALHMDRWPMVVGAEGDVFQAGTLTPIPPTGSANTLGGYYFYYTQNSQISIDAFPSQYWRFVGWVGVGNVSYTGNSPSASIIIADKPGVSEIAYFSPLKQYHANLSVNPASGGALGYSTTPLGTSLNPGYPANFVATFYATPYRGYAFVNWTGAGPGNYTGELSTPSVKMTGNITEVANFKPANPVVTIAPINTPPALPATNPIISLINAIINFLKSLF